jgi:16S rRNA (guanine527-N7)-methyltransferase
VEAVEAGGLGPSEPSRIWTRHVADSLTFATGAGDGCHTALDIGSGVGLPGIPLAVLLPHCSFTLLDRSGRRCDLLRRAIRILDLPNAEVLHGAITDVTDRFDLVTLRGSLTVSEAVEAIPNVLSRGGSAVFGLTHGGRTPSEGVAEAREAGWEVVEVPHEILDSPARLLRMTAPRPAGGTDDVA